MEYEVHFVSVFYYTIGNPRWLMQESYGMLGKLIISMSVIPRLIPTFNKIGKGRVKSLNYLLKFFSLKTIFA